MTNQYVAFLRAINVGGRNVKKEQLKQIFSNLGFSKVDTYLASGNVIFSTEIEDRDELEKMIEIQLEKTLEFETPTFVRSRSNLSTLADNLPFESKKLDKDKTYVSFIKNELSDMATDSLSDLNTELDIFESGEFVIHWWSRRSQGQSDLTNGDVEKAIDQVSTRRNTNTIKRIIKKYF